MGPPLNKPRKMQRRESADSVITPCLAGAEPASVASNLNTASNLSTSRRLSSDESAVDGGFVPVGDRELTDTDAIANALGLDTAPAPAPAPEWRPPERLQRLAQQSPQHQQAVLACYQQMLQQLPSEGRVATDLLNAAEASARDAVPMMLQQEHTQELQQLLAQPQQHQQAVLACYQQMLQQLPSEGRVATDLLNTAEASIGAATQQLLAQPQQHQQAVLASYQQMLQLLPSQEDAQLQQAAPVPVVNVLKRRRDTNRPDEAQARLEAKVATWDRSNAKVAKVPQLAELQTEASVTYGMWSQIAPADRVGGPELQKCFSEAARSFEQKKLITPFGPTSTSYTTVARCQLRQRVPIAVCVPTHSVG